MKRNTDMDNPHENKVTERNLCNRKYPMTFNHIRIGLKANNKQIFKKVLLFDKVKYIIYDVFVIFRRLYLTFKEDFVSSQCFVTVKIYVYFYIYTLTYGVYALCINK